MELLSMLTRRQALVGSIILGSLVMLAPSDAEADAAREPLAIISSKQGGITELSLYQLKRLYLGDAVQGPKGELMALNREVKGAERLGFDRTVLGMSSDAAARYWIDRRIRGQSGAPRAVEPAGVIQRVVARVPRAVGYVLPRDVGPEVQIVKIDGRKPGDPGYPIFAEHGKQSAISLWSLLAEL
jgi:hypothetical protein